MAKKNRFKLSHNEPFFFEGDKGEYEIPPLDKLTYEDWKTVAELTNKKDVDTGVVLDAYKEFFLRICPELENEAIGDNQWFQFGTAYFRAMGE